MRNKTGLIGVGVVIVLVLATAGALWAGNSNPPAGPDEAESQMYTLQQLYDRLASGVEGVKMMAFTEPSSGPTVNTMHTLDELMALAPALDTAHGAGVADVAAGKTFWGLTEGAWGLRTGTRMGVGEGIGVPQTGQTISHAVGDDGDLRVGVAWPHPRFTDNEDGTITDNLTGLIWLQQADCFGAQTWEDALTAANTLEDGECGLDDGSVAGDWRLPNVREQQSLIDYGRIHPALPYNHPFILAAGYPSVPYWTSTTTTDDHPHRAWYVGLYNGLVESDWKIDYPEHGGVAAEYHVWPVKGGP